MNEPCRISLLMKRIDNLSARIAMLEENIGGAVEPYRWLGLTMTESRVLALLMKRDRVSKEVIWQVLYGSCDEPRCNKNIPAIITHIRQKVGIEIMSAYNGGYWIEGAQKRKVGAKLERSHVAKPWIKKARRPSRREAA